DCFLGPLPIAQAWESTRTSSTPPANLHVAILHVPPYPARRRIAITIVEPERPRHFLGCRGRRQVRYPRGPAYRLEDGRSGQQDKGLIGAYCEVVGCSKQPQPAAQFPLAASRYRSSHKGMPAVPVDHFYPMKISLFTSPPPVSKTGLRLGSPRAQGTYVCARHIG